MSLADTESAGFLPGAFATAEHLVGLAHWEADACLLQG